MTSSVVKPFIRPMPEQIVVEIVHQDRPLGAVEGLAFDSRVSAGGVAIPDTVEMEPDEAIVIAVGDGLLEPEVSLDFVDRLYAELQSGMPRCEAWMREAILEVAARRREPRVKVGDRVLIQPWACTSVLLDGHDYMICKESDILAVFA